MATFTNIAQDTYEHDLRIIRTANAVFVNIDNEKNEYYLNKNRLQDLENRKLKSKRKIQKSAVLEREFIIEVSKNTNIEDLREGILNDLEKDLDTKIYSIAIHRDEGQLICKKTNTSFVSGDDFFYNEKKGIWTFNDGRKYSNIEDLRQDFEVKKNYHAHIVFSGLRSDGLSVTDFKSDRVKNKEIKDFNKHFKETYCQKKKKEFFQYLEKKGKLTQDEILTLRKDENESNQESGVIIELLKKISHKIATNPNEDIKEIFNTESLNFIFKKTPAFKYIMSDLNKLLRDEPLTENEKKWLKTNLKNAGVFESLALNARIIQIDKEKKYTKENVKNILKDLMNDPNHTEFKEIFLSTYREIDKMKKADFLAKYPDFKVFEAILNQDLESKLANKNAELAEKETSHNREIAELNAELAEKEAELKKAKEAHEAEIKAIKEENIASFEIEQEAHDREIAELNNKLANKNKELETAHDREKELQSKITTLTSDLKAEKKKTSDSINELKEIENLAYSELKQLGYTGEAELDNKIDENSKNKSGWSVKQVFNYFADGYYYFRDKYYELKEVLFERDNYIEELEKRLEYYEPQEEESKDSNTQNNSYIRKNH